MRRKIQYECKYLANDTYSNILHGFFQAAVRTQALFVIFVIRIFNTGWGLFAS